MNNNNNWITLREASLRFKVSEGTLRLWLKKGWISGELSTDSKRRINPMSVLGLVPEQGEVNLTQAAEILGVSKSRVTQLLLSGKLEYRVARLGHRKYLKSQSVRERKVQQERCLLAVTTEKEQKT